MGQCCSSNLHIDPTRGEYQRQPEEKQNEDTREVRQDETGRIRSGDDVFNTYDENVSSRATPFHEN
jgi:hypothetical protein